MRTIFVWSGASADRPGFHLGPIIGGRDPRVWQIPGALLFPYLQKSGSVNESEGDMGAEDGWVDIIFGTILDRVDLGEHGVHSGDLPSEITEVDIADGVFDRHTFLVDDLISVEKVGQQYAAAFPRINQSFTIQQWDFQALLACVHNTQEVHDVSEGEKINDRCHLGKIG